MSLADRSQDPRAAARADRNAAIAVVVAWTLLAIIAVWRQLAG
jgi:hypothetical protein